MNKLEIEEIKNLAPGAFEGVKMYRVIFNKMRSYMTTEPFGIYSGLTGAMSAATFRGDQDYKRIDKWRDSMINELGSIEKQEAYLNSMADFGTLVHETLVRIKMNGKLVWSEENDIAEAFFEASARKNGIVPNAQVIAKQVFEANKSSAALLQFVYDEVSEIVAIETMCKSERFKIATPVDLVYKAKNLDLCAVNVKTSAQISDHQMHQAVMEKLMWNETYPDYRVTRAGILRPKDWKKEKPTYELALAKSDEEEEMLKDVTTRLQVCMATPNSTYIKFPTSVLVFSGETKLGENPKIISRSMQELFMEGLNKANGNGESSGRL